MTDFKALTWGEMDDAQKGALLLAKHNGKSIECMGGTLEEWTPAPEPAWLPHGMYRIKPSEPVVTKTTTWRNDQTGHVTSEYPLLAKATKGTLTTSMVDGVVTELKWVPDMADVS